MKTGMQYLNNRFSRWILRISAIAAAGHVFTGSAMASELSLITVKELAADLNSYAIIDARPMGEWKKEHIPGAVSFSWEDYTAVDERKIPYRILPPEKLSAALGLKGISETTPVVVYGDADTSWGGEGWACWALSWLGHKGGIKLLDGGFQSWKVQQLPVTAGDTKKQSAVVYRTNVKKRINITTGELAAAIDTIQNVDTRSTFERLKGRIPGSVHISWKNFFKGKENQPLNRDEFTALLKKNGIDPKKPVVYYCTGGIRSGYAWAIHQLSGLSSAQNYEGGMEAWNRRTPAGFPGRCQFR